LNTPRKVDSTTCMLCGYRKYCTLGKFDDREYIEIIQLDSSRMPSKQMLQERCFSAYDSNGNHIVIDPFLGFTTNANKTRKLYLISQENFSLKFPDNLNDCHFDAAIGYDTISQQAIWPIDHLFLEKYEEKRAALKLELDRIDPKTLTSGNLSQIDQNCLNKIAFERGWLHSSDPKGFFDALHLLMSRFVRVLTGKEMGGVFRKLAAIPMTTNIDHPFNYSGSGLLHLAIRWIELKEEDLAKYIEKLDASDDEQDIQEKLSERLRVTTPDLNLEMMRYLPRFPMIAITTEKRLPEIQFEQAGGRIIDIVITDDDSSLLLIDGLGIDLREGWM